MHPLPRNEEISVELDSDPDNTEDLVNGLKWSDKDYGKAFKIP